MSIEDKIKEGMSKICSIQGGTIKTSISTKDILDCMDIKPDSKRNENTFKNQVINHDESDNFFEPDEETKEAYKNRDILKRNMQ